MKIRNLVISAPLIILMVIGLSGCGADDEDKENDLVGGWSLTKLDIKIEGLEISYEAPTV